jgi:DNA-binding SARP family transcriptional activator
VAAPRLEFRVLGPVEVRRDDVPLRLGGGNRLLVLALLCLHRGELLHTTRLIDEIWPESPPSNARTILQMHISYLRRALGVAKTSLTTHPGGYLLERDEHELDLERFRRLLTEATSAPDPVTHASKLGEALSLWRGPVLAGVPEDRLTAERAELEELRLRTIEARFDAELALGRALAVIGELTRATAEQPFRERFHAQLMLALSQTGRQTDALRAYRRVRRHLHEDLGIEPGAELRLVERSILSQSFSVDAATAAATHAQGAVPLRLALTLAPLWHRQGRFADGHHWLERAVVECGSAVADVDRARALLLLSDFANSQGNYETALDWAEESRALYEQQRNARGIAACLGNRGGLLAISGDYEGAETDLRSGYALAASAGDLRGTANLAAQLGSVAFGRGDAEGARPCLQSALKLAGEVGDIALEARALVNLGFTELLAANLSAAQAWFCDALRLCRGIQHVEGIGYSITGLGILAARFGHDDRATLLLTAARMTFETAGARIQAPEQRMLDDTLLELQGRMNEMAYAAARRRGRTLSAEAAAAVARGPSGADAVASAR